MSTPFSSEIDLDKPRVSEENTPARSPFEDILAEMNAAGRFTASVLASDDGLPVAVAPVPPPYDANTIAAMVTLIKDFILQTQVRLGLTQVDEVSVVVSDRSRLICRYFDIEGRAFVLAIIAPPQLSYRRLTTHAIGEIKKAW